LTITIHKRDDITTCGPRTRLDGSAVAQTLRVTDYYRTCGDRDRCCVVAGTVVYDDPLADQ